jgi:hypothetical protein
MNAQYPKEAPPERHSAVVPRFVLALFQNRRFSSLDSSGESRIYSKALSCSVKYADRISLSCSNSKS